MKILLVEDDLQLQESLSMALKLKNHTVDCLETMKDALEINYNLYDLVILDIQLPDGNGIDICHFIRKKYNLPIVFLTAHNHPWNASENENIWLPDIPQTNPRGDG